MQRIQAITKIDLMDATENVHKHTNCLNSVAGGKCCSKIKIGLVAKCHLKWTILCPISLLAKRSRCRLNTSLS